MNLLKGLNPEQLNVVNTTDGPLLVLAGPGTGKTQLLSARTANILSKKKALPENMLILTYTNSAAKAMKERLAKNVGEEAYLVEVSTYHSFARNYCILDSEEALNYIGDRIQITDVEKTRAIEYILDHTKGLEAVRPFGAPYTYRWEIEKRISELKNEGVSPAEFRRLATMVRPDGVFIEEKHIPRLKALAEVYAAYEELKTGRHREIFDARGRFDYDDMILIAIEVLNKERTLRERYQAQFKYIMVDEFQDSNGAQLELLLCLINEDAPNLCCVGDDDQSIYRFQGANVGNFNFLKDRFKDKLRVLTLKSNYRSTKEIIGLSARIIKNIPETERVAPKALLPMADYQGKSIEAYEFTTESEELLFIIKKVGEIKRLIEHSKEVSEEQKAAPYNNIAVLVRKRDDILKVIDAFLAAGIPYSTDGKEDISREKRVRQLLDVLELAHINVKGGGREDFALFKVLSSDYLKIPMPELLAFIASARKKKRESLLEELLKNPPPAFKKISASILNLLVDARSKPLHSMLMQYIHESGMYGFILSGYDINKILRMRDLRAMTSFINMIKSSDQSKPGIGLDEFMEEVQLKREHGIPIQGELVTMSQDGVRIYTAHGSKGQEFYAVIMPFCIQDKNWPVKHMADKLPLPAQIYKTRQRPQSKEKLKQLTLFDEIRLFYVASSRAKANLIFTASPGEDNVTTSYLSGAGLEPGRPRLKKEDELLLAALNKKYDEDPNVLKTAEALRGLVSEVVLTPTKLNNYLKCRRKFFYDDILKLPGKKRQGLVFGNCAHKALEETYSHFKKEGSFPDFALFEESFKRELRFQGVEEAMENRCLDKLTVLEEWFRRASAGPVKPLDLEKKISINMGEGLLFVGKYDKVEFENAQKGLVRVMDYKTGRPDDRLKEIINFSGILDDDERHDYIRQLVSYKMLFEEDKNGPKKYSVSHGTLVFLEPVSADAPRYGLKKGSYRDGTIELTAGMVSDLKRTIKNTWKSIQDLSFNKLPEREEPKCGRCDFDKICWQK